MTVIDLAKPVCDAEDETSRTVTLDRVAMSGLPISPNDLIEGTSNDDTLNGTKDADAIHGYGGNDIVFGGAGSDTILAGDGDDSIETGFEPGLAKPGERVWSGSGNDSKRANG